jgi:uncharacterized membrane protein SpoIIM required for sporulation
MLGAVAGLSIAGHTGDSFVQLVAPHGVLELSCIAVAAAAGLRIGAAIVDPGSRRRQVAVMAEGRRAIELVLGTAPWLIVAGLVEGFVTPREIGVPAALAVGFGLGAVYWGLVLWRGGPEPAPQAETAGRAAAPLRAAPATSP